MKSSLSKARPSGQQHGHPRGVCQKYRISTPALQTQYPHLSKVPRQFLCTLRFERLSYSAVVLSWEILPPRVTSVDVWAPL